MRRLALVLVAALALAGCGGSSHKSSSGPSDQEQIRTAYQKFFSGSSSVSERVSVLQNGARFRGIVRTFASNPLAKKASATVSSVTLQGANKAKVVYTVKLGGTALPTQTGSAVRQGGRWKVGYASLCKLVSLQGSTPAACKP